MSARPLKVIASIMAVLMGVSAPGLIAQAGFSRAVLQDHPLSVAGRHGVTARAEFAPGATAGLHVHPAEEFGYVIEGEVELSVEGRSPVTLQKVMSSSSRRARRTMVAIQVR
jgi:quercetin dioxygenase-like cupin family protein